MSLKDLGGLLTNADGAKIVNSFFQYVRRKYGIEKKKLTEAEVAAVAKTLGLKENVEQVCESTWKLIEVVIRRSWGSAKDIAAILVGQIPEQQANVLALICWENMGVWKAEAVKTQLSLPKLVSVDWRVDVKTASDQAKGLGVPTVIVQMKIENDQVVAFEMDKETLTAMLQGLGKIRNQLSGL